MPSRGRQVGAGDVEVVIRLGLDLSDESRTKLRSIRVRFVDTDSSVREKTTFSASCQI